LALDSETDKRADEAAHLDRLGLAEVAEMLHLDLSVGVLVHGERVDHAHRLFVVQALISPWNSGSLKPRTISCTTV
jgi:hypothetical protein